jgi:hypothetical protein
MIFSLTFDAKPAKKHVEYVETLGACINYWIESTEIESAK